LIDAAKVKHNFFSAKNFRKKITLANNYFA